MSDTVRHTPLHDQHVDAGGRMVDFAGWRLPVRYSGVIEEHLAVRRAVGLFDVSHMGEARVTGPGALELLQLVTCNDVSRLKPGRAQYTALMTDRGTFVDDMLIYMVDSFDYFLVLNAANTAKDVAWLQRHAGPIDVEVADVSDRWAQIAVQGPAAQRTLQPIVEAELASLRYYRFVTATVERAECIVSRTGYTGEDGFEVYAPPAAAPAIWSSLLEHGAEHGIRPAGLAARDTLRLEAKMALYGNDIDETTTVLEADLGWIVKPAKGEFLGRTVLEQQLRDGVGRKLVGFEMRGRSIARQGYPVIVDGSPVAQVTSGTRAPFLEKNIGLTYLPAARCAAGTEFEVDVRGRREPAVVVPTPFYTREQ